ncbi:chemotaxis protein CheB [Thiohalomonas denitrificans]|uniref:chemotaxis protein CheB n=1 Tax=Thiohalomonas denitrificans TaxID=415747 RepID=UPI0026EC11C9|nr:chemotaxis protein CheB [Thiohalomonas denitrificans]
MNRETEDVGSDESSADIPVVGIGASAGGLGAYGELLGALPDDTGMAFVLVQHLAPGHRSILSELLQDHSDMPVQEATDGLEIEPNHIYTVPPGCNVSLSKGRLHVQPEEQQISPDRIDRFFRSLARDRGSVAIGVILSGAGHDGAVGLQAIRNAGGLTFAQDAQSATQPGMPQNAASVGVDGVLPPAEIATELARLARHPYLRTLKEPSFKEIEGEELDDLFELLRRRTGHDLSGYKEATIWRRVRRHMVSKHCDRLPDYVALLKREPAEVDALFRDILINVTEFFREPESFKALQEKVFPALIQGRPVNAPVRIWVPACSSGEEVYSVLISLLEFLGDQADRVSIQIFASDLDAGVIEQARRAVYSEQAVEKLSRSQLQRFFVHSPEGYEVIKPLRNLCVFAVHNLLRDPPFSHIDLVCCRNLLIYLQPAWQKRALQVVHYALNHDRFLLLGHSESTGRAADLFSAVDTRNKIYRKKAVTTRVHYDSRALGNTAALERPQTAPAPAARTSWSPEQAADRCLLDYFAPPAVVVTETGQVCHFRGRRAGHYLQPAPGAASLNLLKLVKGDLVIPLRSLLNQAIKTGQAARKEHISLHNEGGGEWVNLAVRPLEAPAGVPAYYLVVFEPVLMQHRPVTQSGAVGARVAELEHELAETREYLQSIIDDQEQVNEQLRIANEEVLSSNEELQSNNEEVETSREELQSTNEELATVNQELEARNRELGQLNADLQNLLTCVSIPVVMLTSDLRIRYFTPMAEDVLNLIPSDIGRPISDIRAKVAVPDLEKLAHRVMDTLTPATREAEDDSGRLYYIKIRPYKTQDNRIDGAVLAYVDITHLKDVTTACRRAGMVHETSDAIAVVELDGRIVSWNRAAERLYGYTEREAMDMSIFELFVNDAQRALRDALARAGLESEDQQLRLCHLTRHGDRHTVDLTLSPLRSDSDTPAAVITAEPVVGLDPE